MSVSEQTYMETRSPRTCAVGTDVVMLCIGAVLLMLKSHRILYVRFISDAVIYPFALVCFIVYIAYNYRKLERFTIFKAFCALILTVIFFYDYMLVHAAQYTLISFLRIGTILLGSVLLLQAPLDDKSAVYRSFKVTVEVIVLIGLIGWIPFLCGVDLPHYQDTKDRFYMHQIYYVFNTFAINSAADLYRFCGPFLEPGHLGTMSAFLLYIDGFNLKRFGNIILFVAIIMSLSLAAYGLMVGGVILVLFQKKNWFALIAMVGIFIGLGIGAAAWLNGDNVLNKAIVSRLEVTEDGEIAGNNRTTGFFDASYDKYLRSDKTLLGVGRDAFGSQSDSSDNITMGTAGYKRYFYLRGIIGSVLIMAFILIYSFRYRSWRSFGFLIVYLVANFIRDYPTKEIWMYLFIMAMPLLQDRQWNPWKKNKDLTVTASPGEVRSGADTGV